MKLQDLEKFNPITIQCHDNPDADAIASGFGLYCYFYEKGKDVKLVYSGPNLMQKSNLVLMRDKLDIPLEYIRVEEKPVYRPGLLITVDCQYGAGNVTRIEADAIAIVDHHQIEIEGVELSQIVPGLGSCSTLVWKMLDDAGYTVTDDNGLGTALYYGLFTDTNQFSELHNPLDRDARDSIPFTQALITVFRNSNLSLEELMIAGEAMIERIYDEEHRFVVVRAKPCDPNVLGLISDFLLQVDMIDNSVVFNETADGYKISVRSCVREVNASELAAFLTENIGSGGGHFEKAGGFVSKKKFVRIYHDKSPDEYFVERMIQYYESYELIYPNKYHVDMTDMKLYEKVKLPQGYVETDDVLPIGTPITIRTLEGDMDMTVEENLYIMIGIKGEVYPIRKEKFFQSYEILDREYNFEEDVLENQYVPKLRNRETGQNMPITSYARCCVPTGQVRIYAKQLTSGVKVFTSWDKSKYMLGQAGDYLAVRSDDLSDVYVIEKKIFAKTYQECGES
ncbi:MAG: recombinase RecJ [Lachnospiraceae bacterium]|nr:recombinase RecJ [Lachnospiraceae bacterium]